MTDSLLNAFWDACAAHRDATRAARRPPRRRTGRDARRALADALYRHYMPDAADRAGALRALRNVLGSRLVARWLE